VEECANICGPADIHVCDGSEAENNLLLDVMRKNGMARPLPKYKNWYVKLFCVHSDHLLIILVLNLLTNYKCF